MTLTIFGIWYYILSSVISMVLGPSLYLASNEVVFTLLLNGNQR